IRERNRKCRQRFGDEPPLLPSQTECICVMPLRVTPADANQPVAIVCRCAVTKRAREYAGLKPSAIRLLQNPDAVVPCFLPALPWHLVGKIRAAGNKERASTHTREGSGHAERIGQWRKVMPRQSLSAASEGSDAKSGKSRGHHRQTLRFVSALDHVHRQSAAGSLLVFRAHVGAGLAHG